MTAVARMSLFEGRELRWTADEPARLSARDALLPSANGRPLNRATTINSRATTHPTGLRNPSFSRLCGLATVASHLCGASVQCQAASCMRAADINPGPGVAPGK